MSTIGRCGLMERHIRFRENDFRAHSRNLDPGNSTLLLLCIGLDKKYGIKLSCIRRGK